MQRKTLAIWALTPGLIAAFAGCKPPPAEPVVSEARVATSLEKAATPGDKGGVALPASSAIFAGFTLEKSVPGHQGSVAWFAVDKDESMLLHQSEVTLKDGNIVVALRAAQPLPPGSYRVALSIDGTPRISRDFLLTAP